MVIFLYLINSMIIKGIKKQSLDKNHYLNEIYITKNGFIMGLSILGDYKFIAIV